ncbi:hypothetical protein V1525DRAFT_209508 [Lipomyces kononenkoae]|uniref:Uncharacterized protein n=1 Tax=Lipomyces kononenkoae TaxID=34357 RepID=A0ACC3TAI8_LIPKO
MPSLLRRLLYPYAPTSVPVPLSRNADATDGTEALSENVIDWDATLAEYEIVTPYDADILTQPGSNLTIDVLNAKAPPPADASESDAPSAATSSTSFKVPSSATSGQEDYLDLHVRPLTYVEAFRNGLPPKGRHLPLSARQSPRTSVLMSRKLETKMFNLGPGAWHMAMPADDDDEHYVATIADRKACRSRQREKSLVMDRRARLHAMMV